MIGGNNSNQVIDSNDSVPSLFKWASGASAFEKLTTIFYRHVLEEPLLKPLFENMLLSIVNM
jgi:hemoglobin